VTDNEMEADRVIHSAIVDLMAYRGVDERAAEDLLIEATSTSGRLVQAVAAHYVITQSLQAP
jgi:hypothetical protein